MPDRGALEVLRAITQLSLRPGAADLTSRQLAILMAVHTEEGPHTVRGLSGRFAIGKSAVTRALDTLSAADLVVRKPDPADRRSILVEGTPAGAERMNEYARSITAAMADIARPDSVGGAAVGSGATGLPTGPVRTVA
jgi:DNA-binding MarR family transcriptional regulator